MDIRALKLKDLNPAEYNPRTITKDEFDGLKKSLETFGQQENLIVNKDNTIISGHQRFEAMKALGWTEAFCNVVDLDKKQEKKLNVIMNSSAITGTFDDLKLSEILEELKFDEDYTPLRLDVLEPLDLSNIDPEDYPELKTEDGNDVDSKLAAMAGLVRKAIMIEFTPEQYPIATDLVAYFRSQNGKSVGEILIEALQRAKDAED